MCCFRSSTRSPRNSPVVELPQPICVLGVTPGYFPRSMKIFFRSQRPHPTEVAGNAATWHPAPHPPEKTKRLTIRPTTLSLTMTSQLPSFSFFSYYILVVPPAMVGTGSPCSCLLISRSRRPNRAAFKIYGASVSDFSPRRGSPIYNPPPCPWQKFLFRYRILLSFSQ